MWNFNTSNSHLGKTYHPLAAGTQTTQPIYIGLNSLHKRGHYRGVHILWVVDCFYIFQHVSRSILHRYDVIPLCYSAHLMLLELIDRRTLVNRSTRIAAESVCTAYLLYICGKNVNCNCSKKWIRPSLHLNWKKVKLVASLVVHYAVLLPHTHYTFTAFCIGDTITCKELTNKQSSA